MKFALIRISTTITKTKTGRKKHKKHIHRQQ